MDNTSWHLLKICFAKKGSDNSLEYVVPQSDNIVIPKSISNGCVFYGASDLEPLKYLR